MFKLFLGYFSYLFYSLKHARHAKSAIIGAILKEHRVHQVAFYHGLLPERQSHGHGASCFMRGALNSERFRDNMQSL